MFQRNRVEFFVAAPAKATALQFDAETLEHKTTIPIGFGGRTIAIDPIRGLLLSGSLVTHKLEVVDLSTQQQIAKYHLGPWLRTIVVDRDAGIAYVSSHEGLFTVRYAIP